MSDYVEIVVIVEGHTELKFVKDVLAPYLGEKHIGMTAIIASKSGQKGGDIRFERIKNDFGNFLKQRKDTYITMFIDFYGIAEWPEYDAARRERTHKGKSEKFLATTKAKVLEFFSEYDAERRFIPYVSMHEFEALLFSAPAVLARHLGVTSEKIEAIITACGEAEKINDSPQTAPSKRLENLHSCYKKTSTGLAIAKAITIDVMRDKCPLFNAWLSHIEKLPAARRITSPSLPQPAALAKDCPC